MRRWAGGRCRPELSSILARVTWALGLSIALASAQVIAAGVNPEEQYKTYLTRAQAIEPVDSFGEQVSLRDGKLSFKNVDIELPGTGPTIRIIRTAEIEDGLGTKATSGNTLGDWEIEIPRIKTVTALPDAFVRATPLSADSPVGWQVPFTDKNSRCTHFVPPTDVSYPDGRVEFPAAKWWFGYQLVDDQGNEQALFNRADELVSPEHKIGTSSNWVVDCLPGTANGEPGEAFLATAPDGTRYWFDHLVYVDYEGLTLAFPDMPPKGYTLYYTLPRRAASMLVTRIEDRFGNTVDYTYAAGKLTGIQASDGRSVTIDRLSGQVRITSGTVDPRTWTYVFDSTNPGYLSQVILPDGSAWEYAGPFYRVHFSSYEYSGCSQGYLTEPTGSRQVSVKGPFGATATFVLNRRHFGRSYVPKYCSESPTIDNPDAGYALYSKLWIGYALTTKTVTGPGLATMVWDYNYSPHNASWLQDCGTCATTVWTDVTNPLGERTRSHFSNKWDQTENKLVKEEVFSPAGTLLSSVAYTYATAPSAGPNPYPWPLHISTFTGYNVNEEVNTRWTPMKTRVTTQQGETFSHTVSVYDLWARPQTVVKSSTAGN